MYERLQKDDYIMNLGVLERSNVQTKKHIEFVRNVGSLYSNAETTEEVFNTHAEAIRLLDTIATAVKTSAQEVYSSIKALNKAKSMEKKEEEREEKRKETAEKRRQTAAARKQAAEEKKAADKAAAAAAKAADDDANNVKKRRASSKITSELTDADPPVLKARFPDHQLQVLETVDTWFCVNWLLFFQATRL